jgi:hypothetical protein
MGSMVWLVVSLLAVVVILAIVVPQDAGMGE